ncbi:heavy-metal-associated domain-containing protein [Haladaptatus cibarius]|uniref:heavy-metal-associated domain-containing protein n=1 Tax=Haladaptatus cibarius TaxID=453847 RepID=UPI000679E639|nr:heavy metal-associated domain-containing protein [Haladaptatus cibarius]
MTTELTVEGMSCGGCEQTVESTLEELDDVENAAADNESDRVRVSGNADTDTIAQAIENAGYTVER